MEENKPEYVLYEKKGNVAFVTLNRPEVLNAMSPDTYVQLKNRLVQAEEDQGVDVVVITGKGRAFSAGGDIKVMAALKNADRMTKLGAAVTYMEVGEPVFNQIIRMPKPVIAMVNGLAHGAGFDLVLTSDIAIASEKASFRLAEGLVGLADTNGALLIAERVGSARAKEIVMTCATIDAKEAARLGIINKVVSEDKLEETVMETARKLTICAPISRKLLKDAINHDRVREREMPALLISHCSEDAAEGVKAFADKRPPKWVRS